MRMVAKTLKLWAKTESFGGILLVVAALLAMLCANTGVQNIYHHALELTLSFSFSGLSFSKTMHHLINDGLMAIFFLLVGLEIKREMLEGELASLRQAALPVIAACGGVACPAVIYTLLNMGDVATMRGWAIPAATDIAFALGVLALFGSRVPASLKMFLTAVAVIDDLIAIVIIALFYTAELSTLSLIVAAMCLLMLVVMNRAGVCRLLPYLLVGLVLWFAVLKSGVHATLAGVALGLLIPHATHKGDSHSTLLTLEHALKPWVAFAILPIFAFANAGVSLSGLTVGSLMQPVPLGIALGLFAGKQLGIYAFCVMAIKTGMAAMPAGANWRQLYAISVLCGIGFTMSLFIGSLAFDGESLATQTRLGVMLGSFASALLACLLLRRWLPRS